MVDLYVKTTGNSTVLSRALPIMEVSPRRDLCRLADEQSELEWWRVNRTIEVTSPFTNKTHQVAHFNVTNSAPRPEVSDTRPPGSHSRIGLRGRLQHGQ